jgi:hypothetical protein
MTSVRKQVPRAHIFERIAYVGDWIRVELKEFERYYL